jgi:hypothetical protein
MKKQLIILLSILTISSVFGQDLIEKTYLNVIKEVSTAPNFVVIKIKNTQNDQIKEICTDVTSLYWSLQQEYQSDFKNIYDSLASKSKDRLIEVGNSEALTRLSFKKYNSKHLDKLTNLIVSKSLIDSLVQFDRYRLDLYDNYYPYRELRETKIEMIMDSISAIRDLTTEETEILNRLDDPYYDYHYNDYYWDKLSKSGQGLIEIWNTKIKADKDRIEALETERDRQEKKFFFDYYNDYGIVFCHALFNFGVTCYQDCENGQIKLGQIITIDE